MAIEVQGVCPYFEVYDMPASIRFYRDLLGFELVSTSPHRGGDKDRFHWCLLRLGTAELMLNTAYESDEERPLLQDHLSERKHRDTCLYFGCPDVDGAYAEIVAKGVVIHKPPTLAHYGMKQMYLRDPDGFGLCFQWRAA
jgi:glyoxylase I family protein